MIEKESAMERERREKLVCLEGLMDKYYPKLDLKTNQGPSKLIMEEQL